MLPTFIIIGAPKCGTTTLSQLLGAHPEVFFSTPKEPAFFSRDENFSRGMAWYEALFACASSGQAVGEGTTGYATASAAEVSAARIAEALPDAKLIYAVRHPLRRIESIWMDQHNTHQDLPHSFDAAIGQRPAFVKTSNYWQILNVYRRYFGDDRIHVVFLEDLERNPTVTLRGCLEFIAVDPDAPLPSVDRRANPAHHKQKDRRWFSALRKVPGYALVRRLVPAGIRGTASSLTRTPFMTRPTWSDVTRRRVTSEIQVDIARFLSHCGKPPDFWDLRA